MKARLGNILITGASGGIGAALAEAYAAQGITLVLVGRDRERLAAVEARCRSLGADVVSAALDVSDVESMRAWVRDLDEQYPLDLVIANAGATSTIAAGETGESWDAIRRVVDTNLYGVLATVHPLLERMRARGRGQIALVSSLGGYMGMPISPAYSASKAAVRVWGESLRGWLAPSGVGVSVICPGFVASAMSDLFPGPKPFLVSPERAARIIVRGIARNQARISFPFPLNLGTWFLAALPPGLSLPIQRWLGY